MSMISSSKTIASIVSTRDSSYRWSLTCIWCKVMSPMRKFFAKDLKIPSVNNKATCDWCTYECSTFLPTKRSWNAHDLPILGEMSPERISYSNVHHPFSRQRIYCRIESLDLLSYFIIYNNHWRTISATTLFILATIMSNVYPKVR